MDVKTKLDKLKHIIELRLLAEKSAVNQIDYHETEGIDGRPRKTLSIEFEQLRPEHVEKIIPIIPDFKVSEKRIIIKGEDIKDYYLDVKNILLILANL